MDFSSTASPCPQAKLATQATKMGPSHLWRGRQPRSCILGTPEWGRSAWWAQVFNETGAILGCRWVFAAE